MTKILFIDDQLEDWEAVLRAELMRYGFELKGEKDPANALRVIASFKPDIVLLDILFPGGYRGKSTLEKIKAKYPSLPVVMITSTMDKLEYRPEDYVLADYRYSKAALAEGDFEDLANVLNRLISKTSGEVESTSNNYGLAQYGFIVGVTEEMRNLVSVIQKVADQDLVVLITGESGVGKELVARAIHKLSKRSNEPLVTVVCAALPKDIIESELFGYEKGAFTGAVNQKKGKFEIAGNGTIFLDEIGELAQETQVKLLRFLQERQFERLGSNQVLTSEARIIAATNRDLKQLVTEGKFREDLYYRLNVVALNVPPLRERKDDIPILFKYFIQESARIWDKKVLPILRDDVEQKLRAYSWPGNIRELQNMIGRALALSDESILQVSNFPTLSDIAAVTGKTLTDVPLIVEGILKGRLKWDQLKQEFGAKSVARKEILIAMREAWTKTHGDKPTSADLAGLLGISHTNMRRILAESEVKLR